MKVVLVMRAVSMCDVLLKEEAMLVPLPPSSDLFDQTQYCQSF